MTTPDNALIDADRGRDPQPQALRVAAWLINAPQSTTHGDMLIGGRELRRLHAENAEQANRIASLEAERDEADRRAGAAEREMQASKDTIARLNSVRSKQKHDWGVDDNTSFDVIWNEALALKAQLSQAKKELTTQTNRAAAAEQQVTALTQRLDTANALNTEARNQLAQAQAVPEGWKLVPVEPTLEMLAQASMRLQENEFPAETELEFQEDAHTAWDGMLAASPTPPARKPNELDLIRQAICDYHYALDTRQHGGEAQSKAFDAITDALGMYWRPGQEAALRKKGATHD